MTVKRFFGLLALLAAVLLSAAPALTQDLFVVVGRQAPGTKITRLPYTITTPGYYVLTGNLSYSGGHGIIVNADNVTLDLMGFCLTGANAHRGILIDGQSNVEVRNGTVRGWYIGVEGAGGDLSSHHRVIGVRADANQFGVQLQGSNHLIKGCFATQGNFGSGSGFTILGNGSISGCIAMNFTWDGFGSDIGNGINLHGNGVISGNVVRDCTGKGILTSSAVVSYNQVSNCATGIKFDGGGGSLIGNVVVANAGQTGVIGLPANTLSADQNSLSGAGTHVGAGTTIVPDSINGGW
jgi:hypothetical protein